MQIATRLTQQQQPQQKQRKQMDLKNLLNPVVEQPIADKEYYPSYIQEMSPGPDYADTPRTSDYARSTDFNSGFNGAMATKLKSFYSPLPLVNSRFTAPPQPLTSPFPSFDDGSRNSPHSERMSPSSFLPLDPVTGLRPPIRKTTAAQKDILISFFERKKYPNRTERKQLAQATGMDKKAVQVWFQNRRQALKSRLEAMGHKVSNGRGTKLDLDELRSSSS